MWFYPNAITASSGYFQRDDYSSGAPQLVTANLDTYRLKYYVSDNTSKIIETVYSNLLVNYDTGLSQFNRDNIVVDIVEITGNDLATKEGKSASEIIGIIDRYDNEMADYTQPTINVIEFGELTFQLVNIDIYYDTEAFAVMNGVYKDAIEKMII